MFERRSLKWPITLGVIMIVLIVALTVGWILLAVLGVGKEKGLAPLYWTLLTVGTTFLVLVLVGVVMYLALSVKEINLNRRQSNFIDAVTHELKSPIASLKLYLQTLHRRQVSAEEQANFHRYMLEDVERLDDLINHLLDAAKLSKPAIDSEMEDLELAELLPLWVDELRIRYRFPNEAVHVQAEPCVVRARSVDLAMIFRNVIDNAFKYASDPAEIEVVSQLNDENRVVTLIKDNGAGIPRRLRHRIFHRFFRMGVELQREKPGTGLGLYIVHTLVRRMKGRIRVRDRDDGPGTMFEITLRGQPVTPQVEANQ
ncbi:MAG: HAMP domain-containing sensor histidine kinase [Pirellulaceae bacterium]|jgi:signal transduction histidine kinase|nr:HAMP domain-containing sensor histidine kinase [Pirellulaceae bacterium]